MKVALQTAIHVKDFENVLHIKPKQTQFVNNKPKTHNLIREKEKLMEGELVRS